MRNKECTCSILYQCKVERSHDYIGDVDPSLAKVEPESLQKIQKVVESISEGGKSTIKFATSQEKCVAFCNNGIIENGCKYGFQCHVNQSQLFVYISSWSKQTADHMVFRF